MNITEREREKDHELAEAKAAAEQAGRRLVLMTGLQTRFERLLPQIDSRAVMERALPLIWTMAVFCAEQGQLTPAETNKKPPLTHAEFEDAATRLTRLIMEEEARVGGDVAN